MKAPIDKLRSGKNNIIQIIITHRCDLSCSNCTQAVAYKGNRYDMSLSSFRSAVQSLRDWPGIVGIFGGNPVLHPQFEEICQVLEKAISKEHRGLWCNNLFGYGATARRVFYPEGTFNLNAHGNAKAFDEFERWLPGKAIKESRDRRSWHAPIFTAIKDFVGSEEIPDAKKMWELIEECPINNDWSGAVYERDGKAVYSFCEVAAMFDILYDQNHGIPVHDGWWRTGIEAMTHQVQAACPNCGVAMNWKGHLDSDCTDDYSHTHSAKLIQIRPVGRPKMFHVEHSKVLAPRATDYERIRTAEEIRK